ncbi:MAG: hypothetical protein KME45_25890 [Stenomitos rutilans HA7619-LM2]|nr:hypothetical protein [Stenomitos rutilans HA7619-LM2]
MKSKRVCPTPHTLNPTPYPNTAILSQADEMIALSPRFCALSCFFHSKLKTQNSKLLVSEGAETRRELP